MERTFEPSSGEPLAALDPSERHLFYIQLATERAAEDMHRASINLDRIAKLVERLEWTVLLGLFALAIILTFK